MKTNALIAFLTLTLCFAMSALAQTCAPVTSGLIDWWPGNDDSMDVIGANNGTIPYGDVTYAYGEVDDGWSFSGISPQANDTGNEVDFGVNAGNFGDSNFTIEFWIDQPPSATSLYGVLEKRPECDATRSMWHVRCGPVGNWNPPPRPGQLDLEISDNNNLNLAKVIAYKPINDGQFHHVAFVRNGLTLAIYIDGALDSSVANSNIANINNQAQFRAGQNICVGVDGTHPFVGELDELSLYDRALSPQEISAIYHAGTAGKCRKAPSQLKSP